MNPRNVSDPIAENIGGLAGHGLRRLIHVSMAGIPWVYYWHGQSVSATLNQYWNLGWTPQRVATALALGFLLYEAVRLRWQLPIPGHRHYEMKTLSSMAWGTISIVLVVLVAPTGAAHPAAYGLPLVMTLSFADPLMGEMRRFELSDRLSTVAGLLVAVLIWGGCALMLGTPWLLVLLAPPLAIAAERARLGWMDDNAAMLLAPLALVLVLHPWL